jgi:hypothetical protein
MYRTQSRKPWTKDDLKKSSNGNLGPDIPSSGLGDLLLLFESMVLPVSIHSFSRGNGASQVRQQVRLLVVEKFMKARLEGKHDLPS